MYLSIYLYSYFSLINDRRNEKEAHIIRRGNLYYLINKCYGHTSIIIYSITFSDEHTLVMDTLYIDQHHKLTE